MQKVSHPEKEKYDRIKMNEIAQRKSLMFHIIYVYKEKLCLLLFIERLTIKLIFFLNNWASCTYKYIYFLNLRTARGFPKTSRQYNI